MLHYSVCFYHKRWSRTDLTREGTRQGPKWNVNEWRRWKICICTYIDLIYYAVCFSEAKFKEIFKSANNILVKCTHCHSVHSVIKMKEWNFYACTINLYTKLYENNCNHLYDSSQRVDLNWPIYLNVLRVDYTLTSNIIKQTPTNQTTVRLL